MTWRGRLGSPLASRSQVGDEGPPLPHGCPGLTSRAGTASRGPFSAGALGFDVTRSPPDSPKIAALGFVTLQKGRVLQPLKATLRNDIWGPGEMSVKY